MKTSHKLAGASLVAAAVAAAVITNSLATQQDRLDFDTGCVQTVPGLGPSGQTARAYTGNTGVWAWQWGFIAVDWASRVTLWRNGVGKQMAPFCSPSINIAGDCWQSVGEIAASPGAEKWIVAPNFAFMCGSRGLQVWAKESGNWRWKGLIVANIKSPGALPSIDGDFAYAVANVGGGTPQYVRFNLTALTADPTLLASRPAFTPQAALPDGSGLRLFADHPTPLPSPYPGPRKYHVLHEGGGPPPTPAPPAADPFAAWDEELAREGITAGCGAGKFCPDAPLTREQAAVWLLKAMHGAGYVPPPCSGTFVDVPCGP